MVKPPLRLGGIFPPIPTPFGESGEILFDRLEANLAGWNAEPLSGYVVGGSNGEFPLLTIEERVEVVRRVRQAAPDRLVIAGSGMESTRATFELCEKMAGAGADAAIVVTPGYYRGRMTAGALIAHFQAVADRSSIPIILYNVPANTGVDMSAETAIELEERGGCQAIYHAIAEEDVERILRSPFTMIGSDGEVPVFGRGAPHPRSYGTFARVLDRYVREKRMLSLEEAVRKMTSFSIADMVVPIGMRRMSSRGASLCIIWGSRCGSTLEPRDNSTACSITLPSRSVIRSMRKGFIRRPWLAKVAKAPTISWSVASPAPSAIGR